MSQRNKIALAGGVFSNVKINQKISELENIKDIFYFSNMGDGGLSISSILIIKSQNLNYKNLIMFI